ncbi:methyltransferase domain-containing protein [Aquisalimonas sp.]|uniref:class I SAM-dependent methyltransferase n=1 Tax=Aquisalimonas sp. TaxID=1872621 RepID=UPI0025BD5E1B|nr:methyltransferase domain-containing protein [Aquisalimonas sp.]
MDTQTVQERVKRHRFYQTIDLGEGLSTPGTPTGPKQRLVLERIRTLGLHGKRAVDLGCANGLFALEAESRAAQEVLAVDNTKANIDSMHDVILPARGSKVRPVHLNVLDFDAEQYGQFDLVIFAGLLYHLRYPFLALKLIRDLVPDGGDLILETGIIEDFNINSVLYCPSAVDSPQKTRGGNACSFFNERALLESLRQFGFKPLWKQTTASPVRRLIKKIYRKSLTRYRISNIVVHCRRDHGLDDEKLQGFYEARTH